MAKKIYAALTYYHLHADEIEADIEADSEENLKRTKSFSHSLTKFTHQRKSLRKLAAVQPIKTYSA